MQIKNYQQRALDLFQLWLDELSRARFNSEKTKKIMKKQGLNFPKTLDNHPMIAWSALKEKKLIPPALERGRKIYPEYISRTGANGKPIPHVCLKVPTGGGKTFLAVSALQHLTQDTDFILWIVPTKAIYEQTMRAFRTREHPYRQILDNISAGRIKLLEKSERYTKQDIKNHLCLMMLMLPSANRTKNREFLKIFRDSGGYSSFFPEIDDTVKNKELKETYPDLEKNDTKDWIKHSLINVLKLTRPTVILDEAHKAYGKNDENSREFVKSVNRLNPRFVLELSATPKLGVSNVLVNISGMELKAEEMIKLPVEVHNFSNSDWRCTLAQAQKKLNALEREAILIHTKKNRYIRPIALVRAEQTGKAQVGKGRIHAQDVKEYLIRNLAVPEGQIRIQSSEEKGLAGEVLTDEANQIRWIITKDALKEGWDCSFAYILALLDNTKTNTAMTQMTGRIMRQPQAQQLGEPDHPLNRCYIYCFNKKVSETIQRVKDGLESEGLTGLNHFLHSYDDSQGSAKAVSLRCRKQYKRLKIFLPQVLHKKGKRWSLIDYDRHILGALNYEGITKGPAVALNDKDMFQETQVALGLRGRAKIKTKSIDTGEALSPDYFARRLADNALNPWVIARSAENFIKKQISQGESAAQLFNNRIYLSELLKKRIKKAIYAQAEDMFREKLRRDEIRFRLQADENLNYEMERSFLVTVPLKSRTLQGELGEEIQKSLFEPIFESAFDTEIEENAAIYLDKSNAIHWWHRIAARQAYSLQGWRRHKVYPDFLAYRKDNNKLFIIELKGEQFKGNADTMYKKNLLKKLERAYRSSHDRGEMKFGEPGAVLRMMFEGDWQEDLSALVK